MASSVDTARTTDVLDFEPSGVSGRPLIEGRSDEDPRPHCRTEEVLCPPRGAGWGPGRYVVVNSLVL